MRWAHSFAYWKWLLFREKPRWRANDIVRVRITTAVHGAVEVQCRITDVSYRCFALHYEIIMQDDLDWLPYGTRTYVQPSCVLRLAQAR